MNLPSLLQTLGRMVRGGLRVGNVWGAVVIEVWCTRAHPLSLLGWAKKVGSLTHIAQKQHNTSQFSEVWVPNTLAPLRACAPLWCLGAWELCGAWALCAPRAFWRRGLRSNFGPLVIHSRVFSPARERKNRTTQVSPRDLG